jgi:hypothetical protein
MTTPALPARSQDEIEPSTRGRKRNAERYASEMRQAMDATAKLLPDTVGRVALIAAMADKPGLVTNPKLTDTILKANIWLAERILGRTPANADDPDTIGATVNISVNLKPSAYPAVSVDRVPQLPLPASDYSELPGSASTGSAPPNA